MISFLFMVIKCLGCNVFLGVPSFVLREDLLECIYCERVLMYDTFHGVLLYIELSYNGMHNFECKYRIDKTHANQYDVLYAIYRMNDINNKWNRRPDWTTCSKQCSAQWAMMGCDGRHGLDPNHLFNPVPLFLCCFVGLPWLYAVCKEKNWSNFIYTYFWYGNIDWAPISIIHLCIYNG